MLKENMRFNPAFIKFGVTLDEANDLHTSIENANPTRTWLNLCPGEVYNQYIILDERFAPSFFQGGIDRVYLHQVGKGIVNTNVGFGFRLYQDKQVVLISFKILEDYKEACLSLVFTFKSGGISAYAPLYSNLFTCAESNREKTSIVTYRHQENHYEIPYHSTGRQAAPIWNQIRLPLYFLKKKTEQDSKENLYSTNTPVNIQISRVQRKNLKKWQVIANDWINERLGMVSDTDFVYINTQREIIRPYEFEEVTNGSDFSMSFLETQPVFGDNFIDEYGLVNHRPVITGVTFDDPCCDPDGTPLIEPKIESQIVQTDTCEFTGIHKLLTIQGQPNSTVKYRLSANALQGTAKTVKVYNQDVNNVHVFDSVDDIFVNFFYLDNNGEAQLRIKCCLEDCTPGQPIEIDADFTLYKMDGVTLSNETANIQASKTCVLPPSANWIIISSVGTNQKIVKITGTPNTTVQLQALILNALPPVFNRIQMNTGILDEINVAENDNWMLNIPIGPTGESVQYEIKVTTGHQYSVGTATIYASFRIYDYSGNPSNNVVGIHHIYNG